VNMLRPAATSSAWSEMLEQGLVSAIRRFPSRKQHDRVYDRLLAFRKSLNPRSYRTTQLLLSEINGLLR